MHFILIFWFLSHIERICKSILYIRVHDYFYNALKFSFVKNMIANCQTTVCRYVVLHISRIPLYSHCTIQIEWNFGYEKKRERYKWYFYPYDITSSTPRHHPTLTEPTSCPCPFLHSRQPSGKGQCHEIFLSPVLFLHETPSLATKRHT
jgi:hypothetical protein